MKEKEFHDELYGATSERIFSSPLYQRLLDGQVAFLRATHPDLGVARVLSIGCGDGRRELAMAPYTGHIVGVDLSPVAVELARGQANRLGLGNVEFRVGDATELSRHAAPAPDLILCGGLLHHLPNDQIAALLRAARRALAPDGQFVSMDPNAYRAVNLLKPLVRRAYTRYHSPGERELVPARIAAQLRTAGFAAVEIRFTDWFISPLAWAVPGLPAALAPLLVRLDQLLVRAPWLRQWASGFAVIGRSPTSSD